MQQFRVNADGRCIIHSSFATVSSRYPFVLGLPQSVTEAVLCEKLAECGVEVERNTEIVEVLDKGDPDVSGQATRVVLRHAKGEREIVTTPWLCGCDGSRSAVRRLLGIGFPGGDYGRAFVLGDVKIDWDGPRDTLQFFISRHGYLLVIPMPQGMHRVIAQTDKTFGDFQGSDKVHTSIEDLQAVVDRNGPGGIRVHNPRWLTAAPFYYRLADAPRTGRCFLLGDALHLYSPLGAQGLNTGAHDAFNLAWKLAHVIRGTADSSLLDTYSEERMDIARKIATVTSRTTAFITNKKPWFRAVRKWVVPFINNSQRIQVDLPWLMGGLRQSYTGHRLSVGPRMGAVSPGDRCPHAYVRIGGQIQPLADIVHGHAFTLLVVDRRGLSERRKKLLEWLSRGSSHQPLQVLHLLREPRFENPAADPEGLRSVEDVTAEVFHAFKFNEGLVLLRPDGHIALLDPDPVNFRAVDDYFARALSAAPHEVIQPFSAVAG